jgi:hypothetical protein
MKYYKVTLENGDELFYESKSSITEQEVIQGMLEEATLSPVETEDVESIKEIDEEEYEMYAI